MKNNTKNSARKPITVILFAVMMITSVFATIAPVSANPSQPPEVVTVEANFHLYGEMYRFSGLGWGSLESEFGMNSETLATGSIDFPLFEEPTSSGVLESVSVSGAGWNIIDTNFTVPFQLRVGENASLYLKLYAGAIRTVIDFSDGIRFEGSVLPEGKEGLTLTSITVPDGYQFRFIDENTIFEAFGTDGADQRTVTTIAPDPAILSFNLVRSSVLMDPMPRLSISPDPNPLVYDFAYAQISGTENVVVMPVSLQPVSDPNGVYTGTEGVAMTFNGSGSYDPDGTIVSYEWDFGDGGTGTGVSPTHTYAQNGTYTVSLNVTDDDGATDINSTTATIADTEPTADFSATPTSGLKPLTVNFIDNSTSYDGITTWEWDFGDGNTSSEQDPTHLYANAGLYDVTLTVYEADGDSDSEIKIEYINVTEFMDPWQEINKELDALITNVSAADMPNIIKQRLVDKLEYAKALKDNAHEECEAGNFDGATKKLGVATNQVESFASMVEITRRISSEDKASFLADANEIIGKIDRLIEHIKTEHSC